MTDPAKPESGEQTKPRFGELAFENDCGDGVPELWRVLWWHKINRPVRMSNFYASEADARDQVDSRLLPAHAILQDAVPE